MAVVEDADRVLDVTGVEQVAHATDGGTTEIAEVLEQVDPCPLAEPNVVLHEGSIAPLGELSSRTIFVVGPAGVEVDPGVEGLLEGQSLSLVLGPPSTQRADAQVGRVVLEAVVAQLDGQRTALGIAVEADAVDVEVGEGVAQPRSRLHRGSVEVVHGRQEVPTELGTELPALPGSGVLEVAVLHGLVGVVVFHPDHELVLVGADAGAGPVELVVVVLVGQGGGVRGEGVDLETVGLGRRGDVGQHQGDQAGDRYDQILHSVFLPLFDS
ncbi:hypothetical protein C4566_01195, partial [Candidatus Parcubacteria bacterium]